MIHDIFQEKKKKISSLPKQKIIIDYREKNSFVPAELINQNLEVEFQQLKVGDYIVKETVIERKTAMDFIQSMINKRLFKQLEEIKQYPNYLLIIEGKNLYKTKIHPNALRGFILSIALSYKVPIIFTNDEKETATYISLLAKKQAKTISLNPTKSNLSDKEQLQYILESFPNIGPIKSKQLLEKFKTLKNIFSAKEKDLETIIGKKTWEFLKVINKKY
ncbi:hypothetical protein HOD29_05385 [archaeon]|jgi:ERCC4-type nuclease|nr:hypothetical protein [archaeon]